MDFAVLRSNEGISLRLHYSRNVHKRETIEMVSELYKHELMTVIEKLKGK